MDHATEVHPGGLEPFRGTGRHDSPQVASGARRLDLDRARRDDDLVRPDMQHPAGISGHDRRTGIDAHDLAAVPGVEEQDIAACGARRFHGGLAARAATDHGDIGLGSANGDLRADRHQGQVSPVDHREPGLATGRVADDHGPRSRGDLAGPDVGDAVDLRQAVPAVARQAEAATVTGHLARSNDRDGDGIPIRELDRSPVDDDPAGDLGRCVGHWRIRRPCGSKSGSGWSRAGRRRPMISISRPLPPGPSGVDSSVGT